MPPGVDQTINERIEQDSRNMGLIAQRLVDAQDRIRDTQQEMLTKVFDISSIKAFVAKHQDSLDENQHLSKEAARLLAEVRDLKANITTIRSAITSEAANAKDLVDEDARLQGLLTGAPAPAAAVPPGGMLPGFEADQAMQRQNEELAHGNDVLRAQNKNAMVTIDMVTKALAKARNALVQKQSGTKELEEAIVKQTQYQEECEKDREDMEGKIKTLQNARASDKARLEALMAKNTQEYTAIKLRNNQLKARLTKARANEMTIQSQIVVMQEKAAAVHLQGEAKLRHMNGKLTVLKGKAANLENDLTGEMEERKQIEREKTLMEGQLKDLQAQLADGVITALEANNTHLKTQLTELHKSLSDSQTTMAKAHADAHGLKQQIRGLRVVTEHNLALAQKIARDSLAKVVQIKATDDAAQASAQESSLQAESARPEDCNALWDQDHQDILDKLKPCPQIYQDILSGNAQVASLTSMVGAATR